MMNELFLQLTTLLTKAPGNLIYHLVLVFSIAGSLQVAFSHWHSSRFPQVRRTILGLLILLLGQLILFSVSGLAWQSVINPVAILPPLTRAVILFSLLWVAWLWIFPEPNRAGDAGNALLNLLVIAGLALSYVDWMPQSAAQNYNLSFQDQIWQFLSLGFVSVTGILLFVRRPNGWNHGVAFFALAFLGHLLYLLFDPQTGHFPGTVRFFYLAIYPLLFTLPQRFPSPASPQASHATPTIIQKSDDPIRERRRYSTDPKTFHALLALAAELDVEKVNHAITRAIAQAMLADLSFLIYLNEGNEQMMIASGYDLIREENLEGTNLNNEIIPMLSSSLQRGRPLRLPQSSTSPDMQGLGEILGLANPGHLLSTPILDKKGISIGGILLLSPYSSRLWNADDQAFLSNIATALIPIIERGKNVDQLEREKERSQIISEEYRIQIESLRNEKNAFASQLEKLKKETLTQENEKEKIESLLTLQEEAQAEIQKLQKEKETLKKQQESFAPRRNVYRDEKSEIAQLEKELRSSLKEIARLQNQQAQANLKIFELENRTAQENPNEQAAVIASISQELRQPMSSIVGYTDLLLGESVGILGALQRKFVERIKASIERIGKLLDDIIKVSTLEMDLASLKSEPIDLNKIIDNAMSYTSSQTREKNISIHLELTKRPFSLYGDEDAIQQILIHLLQNAGAASPVDGTVTLRVESQTEKEQEFILIQVEDTGGGIPAEDIKRVFSRLYRAENVLIQGVGDTGVGLSIAKTLTEAQHGRIWVENKENIGAIFSVLLPINITTDA